MWEGVLLLLTSPKYIYWKNKVLEEIFSLLLLFHILKIRLTLEHRQLVASQYILYLIDIDKPIYPSFFIDLRKSLMESRQVHVRVSLVKLPLHAAL